MQRSCASCLARHTSLRIGGSRSYGIVPKPRPPSNPNREVDTPPRSSYNRLNGPSNRSDSGRRHEGPNQGYGMRAGAQSEIAKDGGITRRARVAGYLDNVKSGESSSSPRTSNTTSQNFQKRINTRNDDTTHRYDRRSRESRDQGPTSESRTRHYARKPLYPPLTHEADSGPSRRKYHFKSLHHDTAIQAFHRPSTPSNPIIRYRDTYLHLRATPSNTLPTPPPSPFPPDLPSLSTKHPGSEIINFGVVASKNAVSPFAPERGKARKRFKNAVDEVVNGGKGELRSDWSYLAVLNREVYEADMNDLCGSLENGLKFIKRQQERGVGSEPGQSTRRR